MKYLAKFCLHYKFGRWIYSTFFTVKFRGQLLYSRVVGEKTIVGPFNLSDDKTIHKLPNCPFDIEIFIRSNHD